MDEPESFWTKIRHKEMAIAAFVISGWIAFDGWNEFTWPRIAVYFLLVPFFGALIFKLFNWEKISFLLTMGWSYMVLVIPATVIVGIAIIFVVVVWLIHHFGWWLLLLVPLLYIPTLVIGLYTLAAVAKIADWVSGLRNTPRHNGSA